MKTRRLKLVKHQTMGWPAKSYQKDTEDQKHGKSHYGYKNHINVRRHKLVRHCHVTTAAVHDSQVVEAILDGNDTALGV